jgi:hypothetical protein
MIKKLITFLAAIAVIGGDATLFAQAGADPKRTGVSSATTTKRAEGTLMVGNKNYPLTQALAYETTIQNEEVIAVVLSGQTISGEKLKEVMEGEKDGQDFGFNRPYLKLEFTKAGELKIWSAGAGNTSLGRRGGLAKGQLTQKDGRVSGNASQPNETEGLFPSGFDVRFDAALLGKGEAFPATSIKKRGPAANIKPSVSGVFKGNGKEAKLAYVSAHWREPFNGEPGMVLVFTEKDHSKDKKPDFNAAFGKFGSALIISLHEGGGIFGCQVVHTAHEKQGFSSLGAIQTNNFKFADGQVEGEVVTDGKVDTFGQTWEVKIEFVAPLGEIPLEFQPEDPKKSGPSATDQPATRKQTIPRTGAKASEKPQPAGGQLNVKDLALTKDATDFEYATLVEHVSFKSKSDVKRACAELAANLKAQGWTNDGSDLITAKSSILKRKRGDAALTIFVKPENEGSQVKIFTEGLAWDGK